MKRMNERFNNLFEIITKRRKTPIYIIGATTLVFFIAFVYSITISYRTKNISELYQLSQYSLNLHEELSLYADELGDSVNNDDQRLEISLYKDRVDVLVNNLEKFVLALSKVESGFSYANQVSDVLNDTYSSTLLFFNELEEQTTELISRPWNSYVEEFKKDYLSAKEIDFIEANRTYKITNTFLSNELRNLNQFQDALNIIIIISLVFSSSIITLTLIAITKKRIKTEKKLNLQTRKSSLLTREAQISVSKFLEGKNGVIDYFEVDSVTMNILGIEREDLTFIHNTVVIKANLFFKKYTKSKIDLFNHISNQIIDNEVIKVHVPLSSDYGNKLAEFSFFRQDSYDIFKLFAVIKNRSSLGEESIVEFNIDEIDLPKYGYWRVDLFKENRQCYMETSVAKMNGIETNETKLYDLDFRRDAILKANGEQKYNDIFDDYLKLEYEEIPRIEHEYRLIDNNGNAILVKEYVQVIRNSKGKPIQMVGLITDITREKEQMKKMYKLAYTDPVTGYRNRFALEKDYSTKLKDGYAILMKLDDYTDVIKLCGYGYADEFTKKMMGQKMMGNNGGVFKYSLTYNTFLYYTNLPINEVKKLVKEMIERLNGSHSIGNTVIHLKFRAVILKDTQADLDNLIREIEHTYTICQELDRTFAYAEDELLIEYRIKKNFEDLIRNAVSNKEFFPHFQPKANIETGRIVGAEALARWELDSEIIPPMEFIPYLESVGLISDLDTQIMRQAVIQTKKWIDEGIVEPDFRISFNFSIDTVEKIDLPKLFDDIVKETKINYKNLEMEVTETMVITDSEKVLTKLHDLKDRGVVISIDDFSAGNSSLVSICKFPCDIIKIDSKLLWSIKNSPINKEVISLVSELGKRINKKVICEGVENVEHKAILEGEGVELAQGFYIAKPLSHLDFEAYIKNIKAPH